MKLILLLGIPLYILDQITKILIKYVTFPEGPTWTTESDGIAVIPGIFHIVRVHNTGMAFGRFGGMQYSNLMFVAIAAFAIGTITWLWKKGSFPTPLSRTAVAMLIPGILGNVTDRLWHGYVIDFLHFDFGFPPFNPWPSFNVADACICVAAVLLFWTSLKNPPEEKKPSSEEVGV